MKKVVETEYEVWVKVEGEHAARSVTSYGTIKAVAKTVLAECIAEEKQNAKMAGRKINRQFLLVKCTTTRQVVS